MNGYSKAVATVLSQVFGLATVDAATANRRSFLVQQNCRILEVSAVARAKSGGLLAAVVMVEAGGTNLLTGGMDIGAVAAGTRVTGTLTDTTGVRVAKGTVITVDIDSITAAESATDVDVQIDYTPED